MGKNRIRINHPSIYNSYQSDLPLLEIAGIDVHKELIFLRQQVTIFKKILLIKNLCTEEEIDDIINSCKVEQKLVERG